MGKSENIEEQIGEEMLQVFSHIYAKGILAYGMKERISDRHQRVMDGIENRMGVIDFHGLRSMLYYRLYSHLYKSENPLDPGNKPEDHLQRDERFRKGLAAYVTEYVKDKKFEELLTDSFEDLLSQYCCRRS